MRALRYFREREGMERDPEMVRRLFAAAAVIAVLTFSAGPALADDSLGGDAANALLQYIDTAEGVGSDEVALSNALAIPIDLDQDGVAGAASNGQGAVTSKGFACVVAGFPFPSPFVTFQSHAVVTPSGNATLVCHGEIPAGPPQAVVIKDVPCATPGGVATSSKVVITPGGQTILVCHVKS
jgi:hypothetical protein